MGAAYPPADKMMVDTCILAKPSWEKYSHKVCPINRIDVLLPRTATTGAITRIGLMWRRATLGSAVRRTS